VLKVLCHHAEFGGAWTSPTAEKAKNLEFFICFYGKKGHSVRKLAVKCE